MHLLGSNNQLKGEWHFAFDSVQTEGSKGFVWNGFWFPIDRCNNQLKCGRWLVVEGWSIVVRDGHNNQLKCGSRLVLLDLNWWSYKLTHLQWEGVAWNSCCESDSLTCQECEEAAWNFCWWSNRLTRLECKDVAWNLCWWSNWLKSCVRIYPKIN